MININDSEIEEEVCLEQRLAEIVVESFRARPMPSGKMTRHECVRRVRILEQLLTHLTRECGWSKERIFDHLLYLLVRCLDGNDLPDWATRHASSNETNMWSPEALTDMERENRLSAISVHSVHSDKQEQTGKPLIWVPKKM